MSLRHRPSSGVSDSQRRNSTLSDSVSEARNSIRSSTDDLFFPRVAHGNEADSADEESHWQSAPLALALFPAITGVFFRNGSAVVTDVTLLVLAAIFLNWSVRLPWDWYRSAQAVRQQDSRYYDAVELPLESDTNNDDQASPKHGDGAHSSIEDARRRSAAAFAANRELHVHELAALASCFVLPLVGTWLLHTIRSKLSRPSEGLVSNYNLTIFLLASEIRPFSHLLKMVQARTLHLQRIVASSSRAPEEDKATASKLAELTTRIEELEAHISSAATAPPPPSISQSKEEPDQALVAQATTDIRKAIQPEIDALTRAVRRYEKRTTLTSFQTDSRLRDLESQIRDALSLALAAQRSNQPRRFGLVSAIFDCAYALVVTPLHILISIASIPSRIANWCLHSIKTGLFQRPGQGGPSNNININNKGKAPRDPAYQSPRRPQKPPQQQHQQLDGGNLKRNLKKSTIPERE